MRKLLAIIVLAVFAVGFLNYYRGRGSTEVKGQMLAIVGDMELTDQWRTETRRLVELFHEPSFTNALDASKQLGRKFDEKLYQKQLFDSIIEHVRNTGNIELADTLSEQRHFHRLLVTEH